MKLGSFPLRIRAKFVGVLLLAAVVPLLLALLVGETLGYRAYRESQGRFYYLRAQHLALSLSDRVHEELRALHDWFALSPLSAEVVELGDKLRPGTAAELRPEIDAIETRWPSLGPDDPLLDGILDNPVAARFHAFQALHPKFAELLVTDAQGRLVAASGKTSDYWQADENWWQRGFVQSPQSCDVEGIAYDESARVYSLDVVLPVRDPAEPDAKPRGVLKAVLNASPVLGSVPAKFFPDEAERFVVTGAGWVLAKLSGPQVEPMKMRLPATVMDQMMRTGKGWVIADFGLGRKEMAGFARVELARAEMEGPAISGVTPMFVVVRNPVSTVLAPIRLQTAAIVVAGVVCLLRFIFAGYAVATKKLIEPIETLREAVQAIASSVKGDPDDEAGGLVEPMLEPLKRIDTRDELQDLARTLVKMGRRVLGYNAHLEREIAAKTAEISRDLKLARDFQEALLPRSYPKIPSEGTLAPLRLNFSHLYKPAYSVGGDFFDVLKLDDHRAGVFIADVMGHGARSALVTAILRTLLQNLAEESTEPGRFLTKLNQHFHAAVRQTGETIFVTAFYMVVDTLAGTARFASAGHPSPFAGHRATREVHPLTGSLRGNPALGILPDCEYRQWSLTLEPGDFFIFFTDGVHEAYNTDGEEFGLDRVRDVIASHFIRPEADLPKAIVHALETFIAPATPGDDICIVAMEVSEVLPAELLQASETMERNVS